MNKLIVLVAVVVLLLGGGWFLMSQNPSTPEITSKVDASPSLVPSENSASPSAGVADETSEEKVFKVTGSNFSFDSTEIKVKQGDQVKIIFQNQDGLHNWVLEEFEVETPQITVGKSAEVSFLADKTGTFEYYCSVGKHRQMGMKGNLIVE